VEFSFFKVFLQKLKQYTSAILLPINPFESRANKLVDQTQEIKKEIEIFSKLKYNKTLFLERL